MFDFLLLSWNLANRYVSLNVLPLKESVSRRVSPLIAVFWPLETSFQLSVTPPELNRTRQPTFLTETPS